jgi:ubiquinone/menaquinone biosynthesis C-methylase UbiE
MSTSQGENMPDLREVYQQHADQYELLVSREDHEGNILPALNRIRPLAGLDIIDLGSGTGRVACMLAPLAHSVHAFDVSQHMLDVAIAKLQASGYANWKAGVADHRKLPLEDNVADVAISGWSMVYTAIWSPEPWQQQVDLALTEIERVLRPSGTAIILETLGTGHETPHPPEDLGPYFDHLEANGFASTWMRTDYRFESLAEAKALTSFFFGDELAQEVVERNWIVLPECTGIWWRHSR